MYGEVNEAVFTPSDEFAAGRVSYIRPVYRNQEWIGWAVYRSGEALGKVFARKDYKHAVLLLGQIRNGSL